MNDDKLKELVFKLLNITPYKVTYNEFIWHLGNYSVSIFSFDPLFNENEKAIGIRVMSDNIWMVPTSSIDLTEKEYHEISIKLLNIKEQSGTQMMNELLELANSASPFNDQMDHLLEKTEYEKTH